MQCAKASEFSGSSPADSSAEGINADLDKTVTRRGK
jgi:hypothetical protein